MLGGVAIQARGTGFDGDGDFLLLGCPTGPAAFDKITNKDIVGGWEKENADTLDQCLESCFNKSYAECRGFGFVSGKCWIHTNTTSNEILGEEYVYYERTRCGKVEGNI